MFDDGADDIPSSSRDLQPKGLLRARSVERSKHVTHYGPRPGFLYYNMATPNERASPLRHLRFPWVRLGNHPLIKRFVKGIYVTRELGM